MNTRNPIFDCLLDTTPAVQPTRPERLSAYLLALRGMDWTYEFSDDHDAWRRGKQALEHLQVQRRELDPDGFLWNLYAPADRRVYATVECGIAAPAGMDDYREAAAETLAGDLSLVPTERETNTRMGATFAEPSRRAA